ncbi:glycosyltransferase [Amycolatopsis minnesotensis]|uniref:4,4'-diaponeurosporenoate glycosyltransferase n=1 Tax=Amycolatopsis minnesotensis TaxID=337894 RepID=A0ABN2QCA7_9PSEU
MITAVGVVVPARDEAGTVGACLDAIAHALRRLPARLDRAVCVVADRCTDDTAETAAAAFGGWPPGLICRTERDRTIGEVRALGARQCLSRLAAHHPAETLLLSTDADSRVDPAWACEHFARASEGHHAIAGSAELMSPSALRPLARCRYQSLLEDTLRPEGHGNVYGANLGVRADAYASVGGFAALRTGEDHDLWNRLGRAGFRRCYDDRARVITSSRLSGRAPGGLAALLRDLSTA